MRSRRAGGGASGEPAGQARAGARHPRGLGVGRHRLVQLPGHGHSSPILWGKRLFITCGEEKTGKRLVLGIDGESGKRLWSKDFLGAKHGKHADNSFASATPAVDDRHIYLAWGGPKEYLIVALDHDGNEKWRRDLGPFKAGHGFGAHRGRDANLQHCYAR